MGRHRNVSGENRPSLPVGWLVLLGVLVVGGLVWFMLGRMVGGDPAPPAAAPPTQTQQNAAPTTTGQDDAAVTTAEETAAGEVDTATEEPEETTPAEAAGPPQIVLDCVAEVEAGESAAKAAATSAKHWRTHFEAGFKEMSGEYSLSEAQHDWGATKPLGPEDVKRFTAAKADYDDAAGACAEVETSDLGEDVDADAVDACTDRAAALQDVIKRGSVVNTDWGDHVEMMKQKDHTDPDKYLEWWIETIENADKNIKPYDKAVAALKKAPACSIEE